MPFLFRAVPGLLMMAAAAVAAADARADAPTGYDPNHALLRAHQEMLGKPNYWLFVLDSGERLQEDLDTLVARLPTAAAAHEPICISGPDPQRNRSVLERAMARLRGRDLDGLTVVYLGPQEDRAALHALLAPSHATLRYVVYPEAAPAAVAPEI